MISKQLKSIYKKHRIIRYAISLLIILPGIPFILGTLTYLFYAFWPRDFSAITQIEIKPSTSHLSLSAHGVKDNPSNWSDPLQSAMLANSDFTHQHISLDWRPFSENALTCSVIAKRIGYQIGKEIAHNKNIQSIHAIGHSCGAFLVFGLCVGAKEKNHLIKIQSTYLDPVSVYAGFWWDYGLRYFGSCADFSDAYIDTQDTVPGSNEPLPHAHTFDVTRIRIQNFPNEAPHNWPTIYYVNLIKSHQAPLLKANIENLQSLYPSGKLSIVRE